MRARIPHWFVCLAMLSSGCAIGGSDSDHPKMIVTTQDYFTDRYCWGSNSNFEAGSWLDVGLVVDRREELGFLYIVSNFCTIGSQELPDHIRLSDQAILIELDWHSSAPRVKAEALLKLDEIRFNHTAEGPNIPEDFELHHARVLVGSVGDGFIRGSKAVAIADLSLK